MRTQYCREHIDKVAKECNISPKQVANIKSADLYCQKYPEYRECATAVVMKISGIKNKLVKKAVMSEAHSILRRRLPDGTYFKEKLTETEIKRLILKYESRFNIESPSPKTKSKHTKNDNKSSSNTISINLESEAILKHMIVLKYGKNECESAQVAIKWAMERIESGMNKPVR